MSVEDQKLAAAIHAAQLVEDDMIVGLGSGTTATLFVRALGERMASGLRLIGVPTSDEIERLSRSAGITLATLEEQPRLDLDVDGADEVDPRLNLVKGHGGALLREKIVAASADRFVVIVDQTKLVERLGTRGPLPIEVSTFGWAATARRIEALGLSCRRRGEPRPYVTDGGNYILDCTAPSSLDLADPALATAVKGEPGVMEHGLFLDVADQVLVGRDNGTVDVLRSTHTTGDRS